MIKLRIKNADHEIDIRFPISESELFAKLGEIHAVEGRDAAQSALVTEVYWPEEFSMLKDRFANLDELNYLGKRMESFDTLEYDQFLIGISKLDSKDVKDLINLTFNLNHFTLCQDVSSYGKIGREYVLNTEGAVPAHDEDDPKYATIGKDLIDRGLAQITERGLLIYNPFDELEEVYDGHTFPEYYYNNSLLSLNAEYGLDSVMVASNIHNDEQLGQFIIENDLHPDVAAIPDDSLYLLDKRRIGELQRKNEGGVLIEGFYVVTGDYEIPEVYDGKNIPTAADDGVFRLKVGLADLNDPEAAEACAVWIALPIPREEADAIAKDSFGVDSIEDSFCFDFESGIPQITAIAAKEMSSFDALNAVADRYLTMGTGAQLRFKAILEAEDIHDADGALSAADRLNEYELSYFDSDAASFFKTHMCHIPLLRTEIERCSTPTKQS